MDDRDMVDIEIQGGDWYFGKPDGEEDGARAEERKELEARFDALAEKLKRAEILALPSDFEGMTIQDVLEKFGEIQDQCSICAAPYACRVCFVHHFFVHNGQPIRRRDGQINRV